MDWKGSRSNGDRVFGGSWKAQADMPVPRATHARAFHASDTTSSFAEAPKAVVDVGPLDISAVTDNTMALIRRTVKRVKRYPRPRRRWMVAPRERGCTYLIGSPSCTASSNSLTVVPIVPCGFFDRSLSARDPDFCSDRLLILPFTLDLVVRCI